MFNVLRKRRKPLDRSRRLFLAARESDAKADTPVERYDVPGEEVVYSVEFLDMTG